MVAWLVSYPYYYIQFETYSSGGIAPDVIYSNNNNSKNKMFIVPTTNSSSPVFSSYLTLEKSYMTQIVKLSPYRDFKFGVYLPDGTPFKTTINDTTSPSAPDPNVADICCVYDSSFALKFYIIFI